MDIFVGVNTFFVREKSCLKFKNPKDFLNFKYTTRFKGNLSCNRVIKLRSYICTVHFVFIETYYVHDSAVVFISFFHKCTKHNNIYKRNFESI